jgi:hypothetical protein
MRVPVTRSAKIGITFTVRTLQDALPAPETPRNNIALGESAAWVKDYADPYTFFTPLFDGRTIIANGNVNLSLVGLRPGRAKTLGITGNVVDVPNVDARLDHCALVAAGPRRLACYENLDRYMMTRVVPWVPYLSYYAVHITGPRFRSGSSINSSIPNARWSFRKPTRTANSVLRDFCEAL